MRRLQRSTARRLAAAATLTLLGAAPAPAHDPAPGLDASRGQTTTGLAASAACDDALVVQTAEAPRRCTHGPDPAPGRVDVREDRTIRELRAAAVDEDAAVPCIGDGASGARVEAIYAVAADRTDRYSQVAPLVETWAAGVAQAVADSAAQTGGSRTVRFLTDACRLVVRHEVVPASADDSLSALSDVLYARGYNRSARRYLVWADAEVYCGIAYVSWLFARVDTACWGDGSGHTELHELVHTLGGVNTSAPNATRGWHCTDEWDVMCYSDSPDFPPMRWVCEEAAERLLDCGHDDYFHTAPPAESWLGRNPTANVARSPFLNDVDVNRPPTASATASPMTARVGDVVRFAASAADPDGDTVELAWDLDGDSAHDNATGATATARFTTAGRRTVSVRATDVWGAEARAAATVEVVTPPPPPPPPPTRTGDPTGTSWTTWTTTSVSSTSTRGGDPEDGGDEFDESEPVSAEACRSARAEVRRRERAAARARRALRRARALRRSRATRRSRQRSYDRARSQLETARRNAAVACW